MWWTRLLEDARSDGQRDVSNLTQTVSSLIAVPLSIAAPSTAPSDDSLFHPSGDRERRSSDLGDPRIGSSLANAVVIKNGNVCFVADADGMVPMTGGHGFGLYYHDCRFLLKNFGRRRAEFLLSFSFRAAFEDVYAVRDALVQTLVVLHPPTWRNGVLDKVTNLTRNG